METDEPKTDRAPKNPVSAVMASPTRRTLVFPSQSRIARADRALDDDAVATPRPSERPTTPTLAPPVHAPESGTSNTEIIELSGSLLEPLGPSLDHVDHVDVGSDGLRDADDASVSDRAAPSLPGQRVSPSSSRLATTKLLRENAEEAARALRGLPRGLLALVAARTVLGAAAVAALGAFVIATSGAASMASGTRAAPRPPRAAAEGLTPLATRTPDAPVVPPAGGCVAAGPSRMLAALAHLPTGLDVSVLESGFGIGFASSAAEAIGVRVDGSLTRGGERVRVRGGAPARHVAVDTSSGEADEGELELRIDADDSRTVVGADAEGADGTDGLGAPIRLRVTGGFVTASSTRDGAKAQTAWVVPGSASKAPAPMLRAAAREGGGAAVVLRRGASIWVGLLGPDLAPEGPLVAIDRGGARGGVTVGAPSITALGGGAALAWAERKVGDKEWSIVMASIGGADDTSRGIRVVGSGMSPSVAAMPDGDVLLAYAVGGAGAHRVMARRLTHGLVFRGDAAPVSPLDVNAGQPVAAVAGDGRGIVAFFGAGVGRAAVLATPLVCDPGI